MKFKLLFYSFLITILISSCGKVPINIGATTPVKSISKNFEAKKIGTGVYVIIEKESSISNKDLARILFGNAAKFTKRKGYKRFVILGFSHLDDELKKAIDTNTVRKLYLKRIQQKSPLIGQITIQTLLRGGMAASATMSGILVMLE